MTQKKMKIKKGDKVAIVAGKDRGRTGEVLKVDRARDRVTVSGANMATRHNKPGPMSAGGIEEFEAPLHVSNVALIDPKDDKPTRVRFSTLEDGRKVRVAARSGEVIDR